MTLSRRPVQDGTTLRQRILAERTQRLAGRREAEESERTVQLLVLSYGSERFALRLTDTADVSVSRPAAHLPQASAAVIGLMDIRGTPCRVYDLALLCGLPSSAGARATGHVVRLKADPGIGLRVDRAESVIAVASAGLVPDTDIAPGRLGRRIAAGVTLIDPALLLTHPAIVEDA